MKYVHYYICLFVVFIFEVKAEVEKLGINYLLQDFPEDKKEEIAKLCMYFYGLTAQVMFSDHKVYLTVSVFFKIKKNCCLIKINTTYMHILNHTKLHYHLYLKQCISLKQINKKTINFGFFFMK